MAAVKLLITPGDPAGIGPELLVQLAQQNWSACLVAVADHALLTQAASTLNLPFECVIYDPLQHHSHQAGVLPLIHTELNYPATPGKPDPNQAKYIINCLNTANELCLQGEFAGVVTGPVNKTLINDAGIPFTGHTEFFQTQSKIDQVVMMLTVNNFRVALATTHLPLREVADAITKEKLMLSLHILHRSLKTDFGIKAPRIFVCALNPHAGEGGHLGKEEIDIIAPCLKKAALQGLDVTGPLPADTIFTEDYINEADVILAMYHDQGLPVLKHAGFGQAVNITLGLPFIRTSVDHGTAYDLAGTGQANTSSFHAAIEQAISMATQ